MIGDSVTILSIDAYSVTVPVEAPMRHSYGVHLAFTRTIVEVRAGDGVVGLAETAASPEQVMAAGSAVVGLSPYDLEVIRARVSQRFYWSQDPLVAAAIEMACIDIQGKLVGEPAYRILGGKVRERMDVAAYLFYRYGRDGSSDVSTPLEMTEHALELGERFGFETFKLKGGVQEPEIEVQAVEMLRERLPPTSRLRFDPNAAWTPLTAAHYAPRFEAAALEYYEDPAPGIEGMATTRSRTRLPLATNMVVVDFPQLVPAIRRGAIDVVLSDPWYWGGPTRTRALAHMCAVLGISVGMHSSIELGIGMAVMAHTGVTIPNLTLAADAHYHHAVDDVIVGDMLLPRGGAVAPPEGAGWGVELDPDKVAKYRRLHDENRYANIYVTADGTAGPDERRPGWFPVMPSW